MKECFGCGVSGDKAKLFDAISEKGIVKICKKCFSEENMPLIEKPSDFQLQKAERKLTVYERLSRAAGVDKKDYVPSRSFLPSKQEISLRDIVERNLKIKTKEIKPRGDLIDNFHWIIMRARRSKHITQKQLAERIGESEITIKMAEQGIIPIDAYHFIDKLENYLGIRLVKEDKKESLMVPEDAPKVEETTEQDILSFDPIITKSLTISDLREMKEKKEKEILSPQEVDSSIDEKLEVNDIDFEKEFEIQDEIDQEE